MFASMRLKVITLLEALGAFAVFMGDILRLTPRRPVRFRLLLEQMEHIGVQSVPVITLSSLAIGMIFSLQIVDLLSLFRAEVVAGSAVAWTLSRELAPVITTLMLIGKNGSAMSAELGSMRVTEQIDAMETMSVNPIHYLVVPRVWASVVMFPALTGLANVVGIFGAYAVAIWGLDVDSAAYLDTMFRDVDPKDILSGIVKAAIFGFIVSVICTFYGYNATNGARGVGESSTRAVVTASVSILVADYVLAAIMLALVY
ncbi:MAG: MlaE family ABC transporter permease [Alkalispirochaetaceae bacterium]